VILQQSAKVRFTQASQLHFGPSLCENALQYVLAVHIATAWFLLACNCHMLYHRPD